jgi:hypothetical protein
MIEWVIFILKMIALVVDIIAMDYVLWRLTIIHRRRFILTSITPSCEKSTNKQSEDNTYGKTDQQTINEPMIIEELSGRTDEPSTKTDNDNKCNPCYVFTDGFGQISFLARSYYRLIIKRLSTKCK